MDTLVAFVFHFSDFAISFHCLNFYAKGIWKKIIYSINVFVKSY